MIPRLSRRDMLAAALLWLGALAGPVAAFPQGPARIVAIGDLHGDHDAWRAIAQGAGLIDGSGRWTGGSTLLVQTGDITDRGDDSLKIIRDLQRLQREAQRAGGKVVVLVGNHEAMNMTGDLRYVAPGEYRAFADAGSAERRDRLYEAGRVRIEAAYRAKNPSLSAKAIRADWIKQTPLGMIEHRAAWAPGGELGRWTMANDAVALIGGTLFVHGGVSPKYAALGVAEINRRVRASLAAQDEAKSAIINDPLGPLWYRGLVSRSLQPVEPPPPPPPAGAAPVAPPPPVPTVEQELGAVLKALGANRMVVGHTPILAGISIRHGGRLAAIDTGASRHYGGTLSWLEIRGDRLVPHQVPRK